VGVYHLGVKIFIMIGEYVLGCVQSYYDVSVHCQAQMVSQWLVSVHNTSVKPFHSH